MLYKSFRLHSITRDILLVMSAYSLFFLFSADRPEMMLIPAAVILFLVTYHLRYIEKTNRDLIRFFESVRYSDFSRTFAGEGRGKSFDELRNRMNEVLDRFREARAEKEEQFHFLQTVVQHIGIALIAFKGDGEVVLINNPAIRLLKVTHLKNIEALAPFSKPLVEAMFRLKSGGRELLKAGGDSEILQLAVYATEFVLRGQKITLVSIQDIRSELEEKEMEAWQNLIRVLTHEIMNSISPIVSYASSINDLMEQRGEEERDREELLQDIHGAIRAIQGRGQGLLHFVHNYRNLTSIPKPDFQICSVRELLERVVALLRNELAGKRISCTVAVNPESLEQTLDPKLMEQVLINLLINAVQALKDREEARIDIEAGLERRGKVYIRVTDNGCGIEEDVLEKIFIPFFTTRKEGSGIGLSLSRQIMRLHGGAITAFSKPNEFTTFVLMF